MRRFIHEYANIFIINIYNYHYLSTRNMNLKRRKKKMAISIIMTFID